jgi:hypothetical protein
MAALSTTSAGAGEAGTFNGVTANSTTGGGDGTATYTISYAKGAATYTIALVSGGSADYAVGSELTFLGTSLGGLSPENDLVITVSAETAGVITDQSHAGKPSSSTTFCRLTPFTYDLDPVYEQWIQINGQDRLDRRFGDYYSKVQSYQHHSGISPGGGVYSYSFALKPEENQPSGTCNFSRIDTATIVMNMAGLGTTQGGPSTSGTNPNKPDFAKTPDFENWDVRVYAVNYNILRVMSGMGGLAFSN